MVYIFFVLSVILGIIVYQLTQTLKAKDDLIHTNNTYLEKLRANLAFNEQNAQNLNFENSRLRAEVKTLDLRNSELQKFEPILDIENYVINRKNQADEFVNQTKKNCEKLVDEIKNYIHKVNLYLEDYEAQIVKKIDQESRQHLKDLYDQVIDQKKLTVALKALENKIQGYGDEYLLPSQALLDDLIDGYNHLNATTQLKSIRAKINLAIRNKNVADCDYVEEYRKNTAIAFVTNAFNSKADVHFSRLRHDNVGKLIQALHDDFALINNYGQAFRNARITEHYLKLRCDELRWGALILDFKEKEREEQRQIREQMREEEKARREYEKAIKEAEKEELALTKAYEKAKLEYEKASDDQKLKYDEKIKDLLARLQAAEDKNQRALSMAQQTKAGHVYIISNIGSFGEEVLKLGMTRRLDPMDRVKELGDASVPFSFDVHAMIYSENAPKLENDLHKFFNHERVNKVNYKKEFFRVNLSKVKDFLDSKNIEAKFTMKAEALQYRESLQIESLPDDQQRFIEDRIEKLETEKQEYALVDDQED